MSTVSLFIHLKKAQERIRASNDGKPRELTGSELMVLLEGQEVILNAFTQTWPVDTGRSKSTWRVKLRTKGELGYSVYNDTDYTSYVFRSKEGPDPLWPKLLATVRDTIVPGISDQLIELADIRISEQKQAKKDERQVDNLIDQLRREREDVIRKASKKRPIYAVLREYVSATSGGRYR